MLTSVDSRDAPFVGHVGQIVDGKLKPIIEKMNNIQGVPRSGTFVKQGGEPKVNIKDPYQTGFMEKTNDVDRIVLEKKKFSKKMKNMKEVNTCWEVNITFGLGKGKVNIVTEEVIELNPEMTKKEKIENEKRDKELDELISLKAKLDAEDVELKNTKQILESKKTLFPEWTLDRMQNEAINDPNLFWLEPKTSFDTNNDVECQLDFLITPRVFLFICFENIDKVPLSNVATNKKLCLFYLKFSKPHYESWSLRKLVGLKVRLPEKVDGFLNIHFKAYRGQNRIIHEFTLVYFPFLSPSDWISMFNTVGKDVAKYEPIYQHLRKLIICYILEMSKMDVDISAMLNEK